MNRCPNCGATVGADERFCGECGHQLIPQEGPATGDRTIEAGRSRKRIVLLGLVGLLALCGACFSGYIFIGLSDGGDLVGLVSGSGTSIENRGPTNTSAPRAEIHQVWLEHNVPHEGEGYLVIHTEFEVPRAEAERVQVVALAWTEDGSPMAALEPNYTIQGQVGIGDVGVVEYSPITYWDDYQLWVPYYALRVGENHYWTVKVTDSSGSTFDAWRTESFYVEP